MSYDVIIDESAEGKRVVNDDGDEIGLVTTVRDGTAYVDPDPGMTEKLMTKLGWHDVDAEDYPLPASSIERITDDEVHVRREF